MKKNRNFLLIPLDLTDRIHLESGPMRDLFSTIYNYSKDGIHTYRAPMSELARLINKSERRTISFVNILVKSGYITREQTVVISSRESKHAKYEYRANIEELLNRLDAGEDVRLVEEEKKSKKGEKISPIINDEKGENVGTKRVKNPAKKGEILGTQYKDIYKDRSKDSLYGAQAREDTETEYFKIFFLRNAKNPMAEVRRFVGWYEGQRWTDSRGKKYETLAQRCGLAYAWDFHEESGRLPENEMNGRFYEFLGDLYNQASEIGGIDPALILDMATRFEIPEPGKFYWFCKRKVMEWVESNLRVSQLAKIIHLGKDTHLSYKILDQRRANA